MGNRDTPEISAGVHKLVLSPHADPKLVAHFNKIQRESADPKTAGRYRQSCHMRGDGPELFRQLGAAYAGGPLSG